MKATGIIRRFDDLGRIVIPKEIRRNLKVKEGDAMEVYIEHGGVMLMPYDCAVNKEEFAAQWLKEHKVDIRRNGARFTVYGNVTTCEVIMDNSRNVGESICDPRDDFSSSVGMVIAYCRAIGARIPEELG